MDRATKSCRMKIVLAIFSALILGLSLPLQADSLATNASVRVRLTLLGDSMMAVQPEARGPQGWGAYQIGRAHV